MEMAAGSLLGVTLGPNLLAAERPARAKRVISLFMSGGMAQHESFSPRPDAPSAIRGEGRAIKTSAEGVQVGHLLPRVARQMHHAVALRALSSNQGAHAEGRYFMKTNWRKRGTIQHPHLGSWVNRLNPVPIRSLPGFVSITGLAKEVGSGFLGPALQPLVLRDPETGLANARLSRKDTPEQQQRRLQLVDSLNSVYGIAYPTPGTREHAMVFAATTKLMRSAELDAFDISKESPARRRAYGSSRFGQGCLLARRLSASGVRFVEVELGGWDTHTDHFKRVPALLNDLDRGLGSLLEDLAASGELAETLVTVTTEFGRTPLINQNEGRDHYPQAFAGLLAGGGVRGGQVFGEVDRDGVEITGDHVDVTDLNATIGWALGLSIDREIKSPSGRPFTLAHKGKPLTQLFS